ncbi:Carbon monoxide dehydrogenase medium chain [hydrothermal vent metagenome]|uniref:Carbon monoxide dehydrogenase medium chain n=1 Tax=hydrothermal vent metagenome TaxID=652676 RepID=A0A170QCI0_9ZZZZ
MIPGSFDYHAPATLDEAIKLLDELGEDAKILAGGHSLIPMMKLRLAEPTNLIDINGLSDLNYIKEENGYLCIGAMTREAALETSDLVAEKYPILKDTSEVIADPLVRNMATVGGNIAHGDPANDHPATMVALGAEVVIKGPGGILGGRERTIAIDDFFKGPLMTALEQNEILTELRIPVNGGKSGAAYKKLERKVGDYAIAGAAAALQFDGDNCSSAGIALTNVGPTPIRATEAQNALIGTSVSSDDIDKAAELAAAASQPVGDHRGSEEYKRAVVKVLTARAVQTAKDRAEGGS